MVRFSSSIRKIIRYIGSVMNILCKYCNNFKLETDFTPTQLKRKSTKCKECKKEYNKQYNAEHKEEIKQHYIENKDEIKQYYIENKEKIKEKNKQYNIENKEEKKEYNKQYAINNKEELKKYKKQFYTENKDKIKENRKQYYTENKEEIKQYSKQYQKNRSKTDPVFKLRNNVSVSIRMALRRNSSSKNDQSILNYLTYTIEELKNYLESLFESWMNWENHGQYNAKTWDENDQSTWVWNLDHITPQTHLPYTSMEDDNFKICWALDNLRPYNAKKIMLEKNNRSQEEIAKIKSDIKEYLEKLSSIRY